MYFFAPRFSYSAEKRATFISVLFDGYVLAVLLVPVTTPKMAHDAEKDVPIFVAPGSMLMSTSAPFHASTAPPLCVLQPCVSVGKQLPINPLWPLSEAEEKPVGFAILQFSLQEVPT